MNSRTYDIGICIKKEVVIPSTVEAVFRRASEKYTKAEGTLYIFSHINWSDFVADCNIFLVFLQGVDIGSWYVVEVPTDNQGGGQEKGEWLDNPFELRLQVVTSLQYTDD